MSYSFSLQAQSKRTLKRMVTAKMAEVVQQQLPHAAEAAAAIAVAHALIDEVTHHSAQTIIVVMSGSCTWPSGAIDHEHDAKQLQVSCNVYVQ